MGSVGTPIIQASGAPSVLESSLDAIRQHFAVVARENNILHAQTEEYEMRVQLQVNELEIVRRALLELEAQHGRVRQQYEDELSHLREQLRRSEERQRGGDCLSLHDGRMLNAEDIAEASAAARDVRLSALSGLSEEAVPAAEKECSDREGRDSPSPAPRVENAPTREPLRPEVHTLSPRSVPAECRQKEHDWSVVWNPNTNRALKVELAHTIPHDSFVCCVRFSPDGRYLATGCNKLAQIFDAHTGAKVFTYPHAKQLDLGDMYIRTLCFSPNGKYLVTGSEDNLIRIWDISAQRIVDTLHGHTADIFALAFSPDGCTLVSCAGDGTTRIWDVPRPATSRCTHVLATSARGEGEAGAMCVALAPDGALLAVGSNDGSVQVWDVAGGTLLLRIVGHAKGVYGVAFARDGSGLVTASLDRTLRRWSIDSGGGYRCEMVCEGHKDYVVAVGISPDERWIVSSSKDNSVRFWDLHTGDVQLELTGHKNSVISLDMSPVGGMLASGSGDCQARIWRYRDTGDKGRVD